MIIIIIIAQFPVSFADQYGMVHGRAIDRNGNVIPGVKITILNGDYHVVGNTLTDARGEFAFNQVPMILSQETFKIKASLDADGTCWSGETAFFNVIAMLATAQDVHFFDYPPSGIGGLYGVVTIDNNVIVPEPATVYLDNGMFILYPGDRYDQWSFDQLPQGKYILWAERNVNNVTYASQRYTVTVPSDERAYMPIYLPVKNAAAYHRQPVPMKNVVYGAIVQKNGVPYPGGRVELYRISGSSPELVATTQTNESGQYLFDDINVNTVSARFMARTVFEANGAEHARDSEPFTVYFANTLNVTHDFSVPFTLPYVNSGSVTIRSVPEGAHICVDGADTGHATPYNESLKTGSHSLGLTMDGYFSDNTTLQIQPDTAISITRTLKPDTGNLSITVNPANAQVYFEGNFIGTSPLTLAKEPAGEHSYLLVCDGYRNESGTINIVPGESVTKEIDMVATPGISLTYLAYLINSLLVSVGRIF